VITRFASFCLGVALLGPAFDFQVYGQSPLSPNMEAMRARSLNSETRLSPAESTEASPAATGGENSASTKPVDSLTQTLSKLKFDRRPSAILEAWKIEQDAAEKTDPAGELTEQQKLDQLVHDVSLSYWENVGKFYRELPETSRKDAYQSLLTILETPAGGQARLPNNPQQKYAIQNVFSPDDLFGMIQACPVPFEESLTTRLAPLFKMSLEQGHAIETYVAMFSEKLKTQPEFGLTSKEVARLIVLAGKPESAGPFLPPLEDAIAQKDHDALLLLTEYYLADQKEFVGQSRWDKGWNTLQAVLKMEGVSEENEVKAVTRCIELAPNLPADIGSAWLKESFQNHSSRGVMILSKLGTKVSQGITQEPANIQERLKNLQLQSRSVEALLEAVQGQPDSQVEHWKPAVTLLAENWMLEAQVTYDLTKDVKLTPQMRRDRYGNSFFMDDAMNMGQNPQNNRGPLQPIALKDIVATAPNADWQAMIMPSMKPEFMTMMSKLYLKAAEETNAFPYIEQLAAIMPQRAHEQAEEFMRVWIRNHDMNAANNTRGMYMAYSFQPRSEMIPLTRSQQERNLNELSAWLVRLKALPIEPISESILLDAFMKSHSTAEVYRLEAIERVLGDVKSLDDTTLSKIAQTMRANLASVWKDPKLQQQYKTNRKIEDLKTEVSRGYQVAYELLERGLASHPDSWTLKVAQASLLHDENAYKDEIDSHHNFEEYRQKAFEQFQSAAKDYREQVTQMPQSKYSSDVYQIWFFAALGACDVGGIDETNRLAVSQPPLIIAAIADLPQPARAYHEEQFANTMIQALPSVKPNAKYRFLKTGLEVVGNHPLSAEAQKVFAYYKDLVTEIRMDAFVDGSDVVGHSEPFGVYVNLRHTTDIERESGGFKKYLQNQNGQNFAYNYGRPNENYRDKFEASVRTALEEQFEVMSVTFQEPGVQSKAMDQYGWRVTPYAYLLLKAKGPQVDALPSLTLDMDFIDTSGYVVLPIETAIVPLDCRPEQGKERPFNNLKLVQTLDEREAKDGKLSLEIKATARGVLPSIDQLVNLQYPGFEIVEEKPSELSVVKFDPTAPENVVLTERTCTITMQSAQSETVPETFVFSEPKDKVTTTEVVYQRFNDADIVSVGPSIKLVENYARTNYGMWALLGVLTAVVFGVAYQLMTPKTSIVVEGQTLAMPETLNAFSAIGFLQQLQQSSKFNSEQRSELQSTVKQLELAYFRQGEGGVTNLKELLQSWLQKASKET
jgi:hypothetical protein